MENHEQIPLTLEQALHNIIYACSLEPDDYPDSQLYNMVMKAVKDGKNALKNPDRNKQIPLLNKLEISFICDKCRRRIVIPSLYKAFDEVIKAADVKPDKLICEACRKVCEKNPKVLEKL